METPVPSYRCHRYPAEIIAHCVRLYYRFPLSYRGVEELMLERGVVVSYESIRRWCLKFGPIYAAEIRRRRPQPRDTWHLDEVFIKMGGRTYYLWRAVDADGMVLDRCRWVERTWPRTRPGRDAVLPRGLPVSRRPAAAG